MKADLEFGSFGDKKPLEESSHWDFFQMQSFDMMCDLEDK